MKPQSNYTAPVNILLDRLSNVQNRGDRWRAACPAHESKSRSSLSIRETETGNVLLYDHGGCNALEVLHAVGLEMTDLYPPPITGNMTAQKRQQLRQAFKKSKLRSAVSELASEGAVVLVAALQVQKCEPLDTADMARLGQAIDHISAVRVILNER
jgi:hypothetical protein